ncbi:MAG: TIGR00341 family protein, partial [Acidobacteriota bacterium]
LDDERVRARVLLPRDRTESVSDRLSERFSGAEAFRLMLFEVEATVPRIEEPEEPEPAEEPGEPGDAAGAARDGAAGPDGEEEPRKEPARVSREELYADLHEGSELSRVYLVTVALSTLVAAIGLVRGDTAVVIGAMVIAPLLGPNVALALAATLGDAALAGRALKTIAAGVTTAALVSVIMGLVLPVDPTVDEIAQRTEAGFSDLALALAAGSAGSLAFTTGISAALIGVMVAVALLPPLATAGLLIGSGHAAQALGALLLVLTNVACINLAGIATFLAQRVRPRTWWEEEKARRASRAALGVWLAIVTLVAAVLWLIWEG